MTSYRYSVSFESDTQPVETIRGEITATDEEDGVRRGVRRAVEARTGNFRYQSLSVVLEQLSKVGRKTVNKTGPVLKPILAAGHSGGDAE